jgi:hypothetical protein
MRYTKTPGPLLYIYIYMCVCVWVCVYNSDVYVCYNSTAAGAAAVHAIMLRQQRRRVPMNVKSEIFLDAE